MKEIIEPLVHRFEEIKDSLMSKDIDYSSNDYKQKQKEYNRLQKILNLHHQYEKTQNELEELGLLLNKEADFEMKKTIEEEIEILKQQSETLEHQLLLSILPSDPNEEKNVYIEISAGAGGDEASLFVGDMFRAYQIFFQSKGIPLEVNHTSDSESGGYKEILFYLKGSEVYSLVKYEGGVHRVQRVPKTETQGRVHTSTIKIAIIPENEETDFEIHPDDLKIETTRAQGAGGQHVNKTESAVKIYHLPTGIVVQCQDERSQHKNKDKAMKILRSKVKQKLESEKKEVEDEKKRSQVRTGDRSEKIRTYNYPQNRITDHRINLTLYHLDRVMNGELSPLIEALTEAERKELVSNAANHPSQP